MTRVWRVMVVGVCVAALAVSGAFAQETAESGVESSVALDVASAYVFRGSTFNDGVVAQPSFEIAGPLTVGMWGNLDIDDYDGALQDGQFSEIDLYASVALPCEKADVSIGYTEYTYPLGDVEADREVNLLVSLDAMLAPSLEVSYGVDGGIDKQLYIEAGLGHEMELSDEVTAALSAAIGYVDPDEGKSGLSHYTVSAGISYSIVSAAVTYVGQIDDDVLVDVEDDGTYDVDVYGMLSVAYTF